MAVEEALSGDDTEVCGLHYDAPHLLNLVHQLSYILLVLKKSAQAMVVKAILHSKRFQLL